MTKFEVALIKQLVKEKLKNSDAVVSNEKLDKELDEIFEEIKQNAT